MKSLPRFLILFFLVFILTGLALAAQKPLTIKRIRFYSHQGFTRVVVDFRGELGYSSRRPSPDQILVEFPQAQLDPNKCTVNINDSLVKRVKGEQAGKSARIILRLQRPNLKYNIFSLRRPPRLVIDVNRTSARARDLHGA